MTAERQWKWDHGLVPTLNLSTECCVNLSEGLSHENSHFISEW